MHLLQLSLYIYLGLCRAYTYAACVSRFLSAWCVVAFTFERYLVICSSSCVHPRRGGAAPARSGPARARSGACMPRRTLARRSLAAVGLGAVVLSLYKPCLVSVRSVGTAGEQSYYRVRQCLTLNFQLLLSRRYIQL